MKGLAASAKSKGVQAAAKVHMDSMGISNVRACLSCSSADATAHAQLCAVNPTQGGRKSMQGQRARSPMINRANFTDWLNEHYAKLQQDSLTKLPRYVPPPLACRRRCAYTHVHACVACAHPCGRHGMCTSGWLHGIRTVRPLCTDSSSTFITEEGGTHWMLKMSRASGGTSEADARPMFGLSDAAPARTAPPILNTVPERIGLKRPPRPQSALGTTVPASPFLISRVVCVRPRVLHLVCCGPFCTSVCAPSAVALLHACGRRR